MKDPTQRFSNRVENYVKYRPGYPKEILQVFRSDMGVTESSRIADIGSGTGISSRLFLENGGLVSGRIFGVEPNEPMRRAAEEFLKNFPAFTSINGSSTATTLPDSYLDLIVAAQAFPPLSLAWTCAFVGALVISCALSLAFAPAALSSLVRRALRRPLTQ